MPRQAGNPEAIENVAARRAGGSKDGEDIAAQRAGGGTRGPLAALRRFRGREAGPIQRASGPFTFFQASSPPWIWQAAVIPTSCAAWTAMAERSPKAQ